MKQPTEHFAFFKNQELVAACRINGLPVTPQRKAVLEALAGRDDHPSADELYEQARKQLRGLSRTTVYRVLDTLVKIGVVHKLSTQEARSRFDADTRRHPHVLCVGCGKLHDLDGVSMDEILPSLPQPKDFRLLDYSIQFTGLCADCQTRTEEASTLDESTIVKLIKEER